MAYIDATKLRGALFPASFLQCFDDDNDGAVAADDANVAQVIRRAHAEVISWLPTNYKTVTGAETDDDIPALLESAELDFAFALALDRRPETAKTYGTEAIATRWNRAEAKMKRIASAVQRLNEVAEVPANVGGTVTRGVDAAGEERPRFFADGTGDF